VNAAFAPSGLSRQTVSPASAYTGVAPEEYSHGPDEYISRDHDVFKAIHHLSIGPNDVISPEDDPLRSGHVYRSVGGVDVDTSHVHQSHGAFGQFDADRELAANVSAKKGLYVNSTFEAAFRAPVEESMEPPSPKGGYLEPYYHCFALARPQDVLEAVSGNLRDQAVDVEPRPQKFKLVCAGYHGSGKISFKVRMYRVKPAPGSPVADGGVDGTGSRYVLEFQRRSGDCIRFSEIYRAAIAALNARGYVRVNIPSSPKSHLSSSVNTQLEVSKLPDTVRFLVQMAKSEYCDVMSEGIRTLCDLSADSAAQPVLIAEGVFDLFLTNSDNEMEDVHRCSVTGLANLATKREPQCKSLVSHGCVRSLIRSMKDQSSTPQIVRETARLLVSISEQVGRDMILTDEAEAAKALQDLMCSPDPVVRQHADNLQRFVGHTSDDILAPGPRTTQV